MKSFKWSNEDDTNGNVVIFPDVYKVYFIDIPQEINISSKNNFISIYKNGMLIKKVDNTCLLGRRFTVCLKEDIKKTTIILEQYMPYTQYLLYDYRINPC